MRALLPACVAALVLHAPSIAHACGWAYPVGDGPSSPAPLSDNHPVGGMNLPAYGLHLGGDYWSGGGCTDLGQTVYAAADGVVVEVVDSLGSYLDVVVIEHEDPAAGTVYTMYGHIARNPEITEGTPVDRRQPIGQIADVLAYFSPCHLHFEILSQEGYDQGPFCNGCANAGYHVSPGYDQQAGVSMGQDPSGDAWIEVNDGVSANRWYYTDAFIDARLDQSCGECGDDSCDAGESFENCPQDCEPCGWIGPLGGQVDDADACFGLGGDPQWWYEGQQGEGGSHHFTHTTDSDQIDNYGIWTFAYQASGTYQLEVFVPPGAADSQQARYLVTRPGGTDEVVLDQSAGGWLTLGTWTFEGDTAYTVRLDDNTGEPFANMTRLVFDAVRTTRLDPPAGSTGDAGETSGPSDDTGADPSSGTPSSASGAASDSGTDPSGAAGSSGPSGGAALPGGGSSSGSGCSTHGSAPTWMLLPLAVVFRRRRRRSLAGVSDASRPRASRADAAGSRASR